MYRAYRKNTHGDSSDHQRNKNSDNESDSDDDEFDENERKTVKRVWLDVEKQCRDRVKFSYNGNDGSAAEEMLDWNTIRVFVSSTFTDFYNEREVLVKKVFPEVREWCQDRGLKLLECDLRWGIPKDTSTADTILVCLDEIERCRDANKGQPFFINLVGERYGWIPSAEETPDEAKEKYGWINGASITFMEIVHGAYRDNNQNAAFFMRNETLINDIPESFHSRFVDKEPLAKLHLKTMKKKIVKRFPDQVFPYRCKFKQISNVTGRDQVELSELDEFSENVVAFIKNAVERMYPNPNLPEKEPSLKNQEYDLQWLFALDKAKGLIGRESELERLKEFVENGRISNLEKTDGTDCSIRKREEWELHDSDKAICVLEGPSGWGKTALVCKLIVDTAKSGVNVFFHIVNSSPSSHLVQFLLRRLLLVLTPEIEDDETHAIESDDVEELKKLLGTALGKYRSKADEKLVIIIDGLNELENNDTVSHLSWLPPMFPQNIHCIVSTNPHLPTTARVYEHPTFKMILQQMTADDLTAVAVRYLQKFTKKLEPSQLETIISKTGVDNPLWMIMMTEELRIFGDFRVLEDKIEKLPNTMEGLFVHIIDRLIHEDDENDVVKKVLCLTACSRQGLPSDNVLKICGDIKLKEELAPLYWARARRSLKPYLRVFGRAEEIITFSHDSVLKAVRGHLLASQEETIKWHTILADYYQFWCSDPRVKSYNLPYHMESAKLKERLVEFLREDPDSYTHINPWTRSSLVKNVRCRMLASSGASSNNALKLCHMCSLRNRGFNPACNWQNKQCCVLCGSLCTGFKKYSAKTCIQHSFQQIRKCVLCSFMVTSTATEAQLCTNCGFGHGEKTCACFNV